MAKATNFLEELIGDHALRTATWTKPPAVWLGLIITVTDLEDGDVVEVSGGAYARVQVGPDDADWNAPIYTDKTFRNAGPVTFPEPSADWTTGGDQIVAFGLWDAEENGQLLLVGDLASPRTVLGSDPSPVFATGELEIEFTGNCTDELVLEVGDHLLRTATWAKPTVIAVGLSVEDVEVTGGSYARVQRNPSDANWNGPIYGNGEYSNSGQIVWTAPSADWGEVDEVGVFNAASGGDKWWAIPKDPPVELLNGALAPNLAAGGLRITFG